MDQRYSFLLREMSFSLPILSIRSVRHKQAPFLQLNLAVNGCQVRRSCFTRGGIAVRAPKAMMSTAPAYMANPWPQSFALNLPWAARVKG